MKILYHIPTLHSIYAQRSIYNGFRNAFIDMGYEFRPLTADDQSGDVFSSYKPDLFITCSHFWYRKYLDYKEVKKHRDAGMFTLTKIDFWQSPLSKLRVNEAPSLKNDKEAVRLIRENLLGDVFFHVVEQNDPRMDGFEIETGHNYHTIPLAADTTVLEPIFDPNFESDISYVGTNLPDKRGFFRSHVYPLSNEFNLSIYGQDWTIRDRALGWLQRGGQYFNIPFLRTIRKPKLRLEDEAKIYASSKISINVHELYQQKFGGDCNERTFKIPLCGGFQIVDNVACIKKYFNPKDEVVVADSESEWAEMIDFYIKNPEKRQPIINAGRERVLREHTYHHRASYILDLVQKGAR